MKNLFIWLLAGSLSLFFTNYLAAQDFCVFDVNKNSPANPRYFVTINGTLFFTADDGSLGGELWKSDGTEMGTVLVKDIVVGKNSSGIHNLTKVNNTLFFTADNDTTGLEIWKSDGTEAGTVLVKDIRDGDSGASPRLLMEVNNMLFFTANDGINGTELWKSDGTEMGTVMVKDITLGSGSTSFTQMIAINNTLFFRASDGIHGRELWKSDGTEMGTVLVKDINVGAEDASPTYLTNYNNTLFFRANDGVTGTELWKSDGTEMGTVLVKDINVGAEDAAPFSLVVYNNLLFFSANNTQGTTQLWQTDGTEAGTQLVKIIPNSGISPASGIINPIVANNLLFFSTLSDDIGIELWRSDGTEAGTILVKDIQAGSGSSRPSYFRNINEQLFFIADNGINGKELWKSDGTEAGTQLVKDINTGISASSIQSSFTQYIAFNNLLYFAADDGQTGLELWKSNGTSIGTSQVIDIRKKTEESRPELLTKVGCDLFFHANDGVNGTGLWKSDGTIDGTQIVKYIGSEDRPLDPYNLINVDGMLFFFIDEGRVLGDNPSNSGLWKSDGTETGTVRVKGMPVPDEEDSVLFEDRGKNQLAVNGILYFVINYEFSGTSELWKSDGTEAGTIPIKNLTNTGRDSPISNLTEVNGMLFFFVNDGINNFSLWKSDGTEVGTTLVKGNLSINERTNPTNLINVNNTLFFSAGDATNGQELWKSDGTPSGTLLVKDVNVGNDGSYPFNFINVNGILFFTAYQDNTGIELWKSDGTVLGTQLVKAIQVEGDTSPENLTNVTNVDGTLFFTIVRTATQLWKSDGTEAGTVLLKTINIDPDNRQTADFVAINNLLYFTADDGIHGNELWSSDGTIAGTQLVMDFWEGSTSSNPFNLIKFQGKLFFTANIDTAGIELLKYAPMDISLPSHFLIVSDTFNCQLVDGDIPITISNAEIGVQYELVTTEGNSLNPVVIGTGTGADLTLNLLQADVLNATVSYQVKATKDGNSINLCDLAKVGIIAPPTIDTTGLRFTNICGIDKELVARNSPGSIGEWSFINQNPTNSANFNAANNPITTLTGVIGGNYTAKWTVSDGFCVNQFSEVMLNFSPDEDIPGGDGIQDCVDGCLGGDDSMDSDNSGLPDDCDCSPDDTANDFVAIDLATLNTLVAAVINMGQDTLLRRADFEMTTTAIIATKVLNSYPTVLFQAGNNLTLNPGFHAQAGSDFIATIANCLNDPMAITSNEETIFPNQKQQVAQAEFLAPTPGGVINLKILPNIIRQEAAIKITLPKDQFLSLYLYNQQGQRLRTFIRKEQRIAGTYYYKLDASQLFGGFYFLQLQGNRELITKKFVVTK